MAKYESKTGYGLSGKVGPIIESSWNGIRYVKARPAHYQDKRSTAQLAQRNKLKLCLPIVRCMKPLVQIGFKEQAVRQSAYNACMSRNMQCAIVGEYPNQQLSYPHIILGEGPLAVPTEITAQLLAGELWISWNSSSQESNSSPNDKTLIALYNATRNCALQWLRQSQRQDGITTLPLPHDWLTDELHCYLGFQNNAENLCSNMVWVEINGQKQRKDDK